MKLRVLLLSLVLLCLGGVNRASAVSIDQSIKGKALQSGLRGAPADSDLASLDLIVSSDGADIDANAYGATKDVYTYGGNYRVLRFATREALDYAYEDLKDKYRYVSYNYLISENDDVEEGAGSDNKTFIDPYAKYSDNFGHELDKTRITGNAMHQMFVDNKDLDNFTTNKVTCLIMDSAVDYKLDSWLNNYIIKDRCRSWVSDNGTQLDYDDALGTRHFNHVASVIKSNCMVRDNMSLIAYRISNSSGNTSTSVILEALEFALDEPNLDVINISSGVTYDISRVGQLDYAMFDKLKEQGVIICVSAGNENMEIWDGSASYSDSVVSVGSVDFETIRNDGFVVRRRSSFSNYGDRLDFTALGNEVYAGRTLDGKCYYGRGTSFSCPYLASIFLTLKSIEQNLSFDTYYEIMKGFMSASSQALGKTEGYGWGYPDFRDVLVCTCGAVECHGLYHRDDYNNITVKSDMSGKSYYTPQEIPEPLETQEPTYVYVTSSPEPVYVYVSSEPVYIYVTPEPKESASVTTGSELVLPTPVPVIRSEPTVIDDLPTPSPSVTTGSSLSTEEKVTKKLVKPVLSYGNVFRNGKSSYVVLHFKNKKTDKCEIVYWYGNKKNNAKIKYFKGKTVKIKLKKGKTTYKVRKYNSTSVSAWLKKTIKV